MFKDLHLMLSIRHLKSTVSYVSKFYQFDHSEDHVLLFGATSPKLVLPIHVLRPRRVGEGHAEQDRLTHIPVHQKRDLTSRVYAGENVALDLTKSTCTSFGCPL